ncbi:MAG TPA: HEAT repeat domain-containing protein [Planctomycetota bacterium]|nr:HEAT repeat domain-containing protein [Planctomycetota bacterium]
MLDLLLAASCFYLPLSAPPATALDAAVQAQAHDDKPLRALEAWMKLWGTGKIEFRRERDDPRKLHEWEHIGKDSIAVRFGIAPKNAVGDITWKKDLEMILDAVVKLDNAAAAQALLEVAAVGMDPSKYTIEMAAYEVRSLGEERLKQLQSAAAKEEIASAARGSAKVDKNKVLGVQAAAVRCLGSMNDKSYRSVIEGALNDTDEIVRVHAAEALSKLGMEESGLALVGALDREANDAVLAAVVHSLQTIFAKYRDSGPAADAGKESKPAEPAEKGEKKGEAAPAEPAPASSPAAPAAPAPAAAPAELPEVLRLVVRSSIRALGRSNWRADMALVRLLSEFRSVETVPALIAVLERFRDHPDDVKSGKLSGLLLYQAHELLLSMTGAVIPATSPEKWREFWEKEKDNIQVTKKRELTGLEKTVAGGFCGIPVQGTRVVFVVDLSGSMDWDMDKVEADGRKTLQKRIDFAKRELCRAMDVIAPNAMFNLVTFSDDAEIWKEKGLVPATEPNRRAFKQHVNEKIRAIGATNVWAGLQEALKIKSQVYGTRYESNVDEVFVLSDGAPTVGEVTDPIEILRLVEEANKFANMRINTIFISSATPPEHQRNQPKMEITPQELMKRLAEKNGGKFREL